jgi:hypothetical protein
VINNRGLWHVKKREASLVILPHPHLKVVLALAGDGSVCTHAPRLKNNVVAFCVVRVVHGAAVGAQHKKARLALL